MTRNEAREQITQDAAGYLKPDNQSQRRHGKPSGYICPICGSGTKKNGTGITTKDGVHFTCWAGCFSNADIFDIIGLQYDLTDYNAKLKKACALYGIDYSQLESDGKAAGKKGNKNMTYNAVESPRNGEKGQGNMKPRVEGKNASTGMLDPVEAKTDYTQHYKAWAGNRRLSDYLTKRGISEATQALFSIGYCSDWKHPKAPKMKPSPRVIIPTSRYSYTARYAGEGDFIDWQGNKQNKSKVGKGHLFNAQALDEGQEPVFVVEGEIDALSVIEAGYKAVALGSANQYRKLIDYVTESKPNKPLLIALDNDKTGEEASAKLIDGLRGLGIDCCTVNIIGEYKDPNDYLVADREAFIKALGAAIETSKTSKETAQQEYIEQNNAVNHLMGFIGGISASVNTSYTPTGFSELDKHLDGGLYEGLYIVGAISSLGKTTLALQIADQVAKAGRDVLIFSLEMSRNELLAKSISRLTAQICLSEGKPIEQAKTTRGITVNRFWRGYSQEEKDLVSDAIDRYGDFGEHIFITEGIGNIGVEQVRDAVKKHIYLTGNTPVVVIDYLQILASYIDPEHPNRVLTDKQNVDKNVLELKRMSRDYKLPVVGISSFNRENYKNAVAMQAFKESGAIEYSSDVLIGLQLEGAGDSDFDVDEAKSREPRKVEAKILKNRNGETGNTALFDYYAKFNYFQEGDISSKTYICGGKSDKPKQSRREKERAKLEAAFTDVQVEDEALLLDMADRLDISKKKVANMIAEYGGYILDGDIVKQEPLSQFFKESGNTPIGAEQQTESD